MNLTINKNQITLFLFGLMCLSVFFLRWYMNSNLVSLVALISSPLIIYEMKKNKQLTMKKISIYIIFVLYVLINLLFTFEHKKLVDELIRHTILPFLTLIFISNNVRNSSIFKKNSNILFIFLNVYYFINIIITYLQTIINGFMVRNFSDNTFYTDQIDGLFGTNGTHRLCIFNLICLFINLQFFDSENKKYRKISRIMFVFILISSVYISAFNDNRMYYLLLVVFLSFVLYKNKKRNSIKQIISKNKMLKVFSIIMLSFILFISLYNFNYEFRTFINNDIYENNIKRTIDRTINSKNNSVGKKEERIELTKYALKNGNGYLIGKGIGAIQLYNDPKLPKHFGLNETTLRIYTGGIIYLLLIVMIYAINISSSLNKNDTFMKIYIFITLLIFSFYTNAFTHYDNAFLISLFYVILIRYYETKVISNEN